jgi:hypothetical protein
LLSFPSRSFVLPILFFLLQFTMKN